MSQGDREFEKKILSVASQELKEEVKDFNIAIAQVDYHQAAQLVHKIKHKISLFYRTLSPIEKQKKYDN